MAKEVTPEQIEMIEEMVARAHVAADVIATYDQERVDKLCQAVAAALYDMKTWAQMADEAVDQRQVLEIRLQRETREIRSN